MKKPSLLCKSLRKPYIPLKRSNPPVAPSLQKHLGDYEVKFRSGWERRVFQRRVFLVDFQIRDNSLQAAISDPPNQKYQIQKQNLENICPTKLKLDQERLDCFVTVCGETKFEKTVMTSQGAKMSVKLLPILVTF